MERFEDRRSTKSLQNAKTDIFLVNSSPFLAIATVNAHVNKYAETFPDDTRDIQNNMYVDDCLTGADTEK